MIQCDSGHLNGDLIACARHRIYDIKARADDGQITHVLYIIHLPRQMSSSLVSFQGNPWISTHIDDLKPSTNDVIAPHEAVGVPISKLFIGDTPPPPVASANENQIYPAVSFDLRVHSEEVEKPEALGAAMELSVEDIGLDEYDENSIGAEQSVSVITVQDGQLVASALVPTDGSDSLAEEHAHVSPFMAETSQISDIVLAKPSSLYVQAHTRRPLFRRLYSCIQPAAAKLKDFITKRCTKRVEILVHLIPKDASNDLGTYSKSKHII